MTFVRAVENRLSEDAKKLSSINVSGSWFSDNLDYSIEHSEFWPEDNSYKQIVFFGQVQLTISAINLKALDDLNPIELAFGAKMESGGQIQVTLVDSSSISGASVTTSFSVAPQPESAISSGLNDLSWAVYRTNPVFVDKKTLVVPRVDATITITPNDPNDAVRFANPVVSGTLDQAYYSEAARNIFAVMPNFFTDVDETENPPSAVTRFIDVSFSGLDVAVRAYRDYRFFTVADGRNEANPATLSDLVWPSDAGLDEVKWLTQFSGTEPVAKLSSTLDPSDPFVLGSPTDPDEYADPGAGGSLLGGSDTLRFSTTGVNDPPVGTVEVTRDFLRWQAQYGYYGMRAGSIAAVRESVKRVMVEPKEVDISLQHDGPFTVIVKTPWEQTYGANADEVGEPSAVVLEAIARAKPIGVKITHELT